MSLYAHAPVTLSFIVLNGLFRIFFNEKIWALSMHRVVNNYEFYRLFTSGFVFSSPPVFMTGIIVAHIFRDIERQLGIFKFSSFISLSFVFTTASQMALSMAVSVLSGNSLRYLPVSGSYYYILACLPLYYRNIPALYKVPIHLLSSVCFSEKSFVYFLVFQAVASMSDSISSTGSSSQVHWLVPYLSIILNSAPAFAIGWLYASNFARLQSFRLPVAFKNAVAAVSSRISQAWIAAAGTADGTAAHPGGAGVATRATPDGNPYRTLLGGGDSTNDFQTYQQDGLGLGLGEGAQQLPNQSPNWRASDEALNAAIRASLGQAGGDGDGDGDGGVGSNGGGSAVTVSDENIDTLLALGLAELTRDQARSVLERSFNDMDRAANMLLSGEY